jgi:hypothetical protein
MWTHSGGDTLSPRAKAATIDHQLIGAGGGVVLLHSHDRCGDAERVCFIEDALRRPLAVAHEHRFEIVTASEWLRVWLNSMCVCLRVQRILCVVGLQS